MNVFATGPGVSGVASEEIATSIMEALTLDMEFTTELPVIREMAIGPEDRLWIVRSGPDGVSAGPTDLHAAAGAYLGTLNAADFPFPDAFGPAGLMAYVETDELGAPLVQVMRLVDLAPAFAESQQ